MLAEADDALLEEADDALLDEADLLAEAEWLDEEALLAE